MSKYETKIMERTCVGTVDVHDLVRSEVTVVLRERDMSGPFEERIRVRTVMLQHRDRIIA